VAALGKAFVRGRGRRVREELLMLQGAIRGVTDARRMVTT
jgi:hypothetical protein